jgi:hypothetical protein
MTEIFRSKSEYNIGLTSIVMGRDGPKEEWLIAELLDLVKSGRSDAEITAHLTSKGAVTSDSIAAGIDRARSILTFEDASAALAAGQRDAKVLVEAREKARNILLTAGLRLGPVLRARLSKLGASEALIDHLTETAEMRDAVKSAARFTTILGGLVLAIGVAMPLFQDGWTIYAFAFILVGLFVMVAGWSSRESE